MHSYNRYELKQCLSYYAVGVRLKLGVNIKHVFDVE